MAEDPHLQETGNFLEVALPNIAFFHLIVLFVMATLSIENCGPIYVINFSVILFSCEQTLFALKLWTYICNYDVIVVNNYYCGH